jgi:O-antigen/teichoic acid export membrane protein
MKQAVISPPPARGQPAASSGRVAPIDATHCVTTAPAPLRLLRGDTLAQSMVALALLAVGQRLVGFLRSVVVCGWLPPDQLGVWDLANRFLLLAAPLVVLGLPGSFGRYLEHYRQRGALRCVLVRTATVCGALALVAVLVMTASPDFFEQQVFGASGTPASIAILAAALLIVAAYNFLTEVLTSLRLNRIGSLLQLFNSVAFAGLSVGLLALWRLDGMAIVVAYAGRCLLLLLAAAGWLLINWSQLPNDPSPVNHAEMWRKLAPFALCVWVTNFLYNLFETIDRYMLLHVGQLLDAQSLIGQYHSAQVIPLLLASVASLLAGVILPHLTHDWEIGNRKSVSDTLNLTVKLLAIAMFAAGVVIVFAAPVLFDLVWGGKYADGLALLPLALASCAWLGLFTVAQMYLWCAERPTMSCVCLALGLVLNVALNYVLIPRHGLPGAVTATMISHCAVLALVLALNRRLGMQIDRATVAASLLPLALLLATWAAAAVLMAVILDLAIGHKLLNDHERNRLGQIRSEFCEKFPSRKSAGTP